MGYVETILEPGERITHRAYLHWIVYLRGIVLVIFGGVIHFAAPEPDLEYGGMAGVNTWAIAGVLVLLGAASLLRAAINRWTTEIAVTDRRVILKRGLITRDTHKAYARGSPAALLLTGHHPQAPAVLDLRDEFLPS